MLYIHHTPKEREALFSLTVSTNYHNFKYVPTLPYPTLPYPTLPYPTLPYPTLPYPLGRQRRQNFRSERMNIALDT